MKWPTVALCLLFLSCERATGGMALSSGQASSAPQGRSAAAVTDTATVGGYRLEILDRDGACAVRYEGTTSGVVAIAPKPPCHFLRRQSANPQLFSYPDVQVDAVLIIAGTAIGDDKRKTWNLAPGLICGEETQGILVKNGKIRTSRSVQKGGVACADQGLDEKDFWAFAHDDGR